MTKRPNIALIVTDSQGYNVLGDVGNGYIQTPNIDKLAEDGLLCTRAYNVCPLCAPARAGLFTGQYPNNTGVWSNDLPKGDNIRSIGHYFKEAGYKTCFVGKWHLDGFDYFGTGIAPEEFDATYWYDARTYMEQLTDAERTLWREGLKSPESLKAHNIERNFTWASGITDRAIDFLNSLGEDEPYVLIVAYDEPHSPSTCPPPFRDMYLDLKIPYPPSYYEDQHTKPIHHSLWHEHRFMNLTKDTSLSQPLYFGCSTYVDDEIGKLIKAIDTKDTENTLTVFTSDHGHYMGAHKLDAKGPALYEEVINIPLIFKGLNLPKGAQCQELISHIDLLPTFMSLASIETPDILEGVNQLSTLSDRNKSSRDYCFLEFTRFANTHDALFGFIPIRAIVSKNYKLVINLHQTDELYELKNDPYEMNNLINSEKHSEMKALLHQKLLENMNEIRDPFRGPTWNNRPWSKHHIDWYEGKKRVRKNDGYLPDALSYDTGFPVT